MAEPHGEGPFSCGDDYSFAYVARWSDGFSELVRDTAERVVGCAKQIPEGLELSGRQMRWRAKSARVSVSC